MAEAIILPLANSILKTIASFTGDLVTENVVEQSQALKSVKEDVKAIAKHLHSITSVLEDAEAKQYSNAAAAVKVWLSHLKSIIFDIDDLLDEAATDALQMTLNQGHAVVPQLRYSLSIKPLISRFHKIKDLRLQLERTVFKKNEFGVTDSPPVEAPTSVKRDIFDVSGFVNPVNIVGRDEAKNNIINRVLGLGNDECTLSVLPILGMGGIGKTALAKLVYSDIDQFDIKLWVCVSDKFDIQKLLQDILKAITSYKDTSNYTLEDLAESLQCELIDKKFLLVLDDLWEDDVMLWKRLKDILSVGERGSVILITTRIEKVASITQTVEPYHLDKLSDSVCWHIFSSLAFVDGDEQERYPTLCEIGHSIVIDKCCGIPLVVQCLGSLLRGERDEGEWMRIKNMDNLNQLDDGRYNTVKQLLKLSYDKLPSHLKSCFAHLSLYAKDTVYVTLCNIYYWSALGVLQLHDKINLERNIINELLSRSMLQDVEWNFNNTIVTFKMHDLLHDLAGDVLGDEFAVVTDENKLSVPASSRYISWGLSYLADNDFPEQMKARKARAFIFYYEMRCISKCFLEGILANMPCLRILGLGSGQFEELPTSIGNLKHLRVLNLSNNSLIKSLPDTVCELLNLECLLVDRCQQLEELPTEIYKLINLRFLTLTTCQRSLVGTNFNRLPSLQHLQFISCMELESLWEDDIVGGLTSLCYLSIVNCPKLTRLPDSMKLLVGLEDLRFVNCEELDLERGEALSGLLSLGTFALCGVPRLSCLPNDMGSASSSLKYMYIQDCQGLYELPNWLQSCACLESLRIVNCPHISRRCAAPGGEDWSLIQHLPEFWLDNCCLIASKQQ
ncbi:putative disease resistance protein RGA1 [Silene latifolia]|uniref:putative disease resistance protein RGA1 n=1 Tax=Silene latifolia TaxID=37657 RepID=UPI003D77EA2F